jgi:hypothetical protein
MTNVSTAYAPLEVELVNILVMGLDFEDKELAEKIKKLEHWFGKQ